MEIFSQLVLNSIIAGAIYTLMALGFNLIYGATRFFNLAHGVLAVVGGYATFFFTKYLGWNIYLSVILGVFVAGLFGYLIDKVIYKTLRKRKASNMVLLVASLGVFTALQAIIAIFFTSQFQTLSWSPGEQRIYNIAGGVITQTQVVIFIAGILIMFFLSLLLNRTLLGKAIKAISDDEEVSKIIGIHTNKVIGYIFFMGSAIAGFAGIMVGFDTGIEPTMGMDLLLKGVVASIIGGVGNLYGGVLGAFLLGFAENFGIWKISGEWKDVVAFLLLIIFLVFRPQGIFRK